MFILRSNQKRCNPFAPFTNGSGTRFAQLPAHLYDEVPDPAPPADYSDETYYRTEQEDAPYVVYTRKPDEQIQAARWIRIKAKRDDLTDNGGCLVGGKWFHTDTKSKQQQMALTMMGASLPANLLWKTMDGSFVTMTPALAGQLFAAQITREQIIFSHAESLRADINADINAGWPARYEAA